MENETSVNTEIVAETPIETSTDVSTESVIEEVAEPQVETVQSPEENAKFASVRREAETKAAEKAKKEFDSKFSDLFGEEYGIKSVDDYLDAIKEQREQDKVNKLVEQNVPEEYAKEMVENKKFRDKYENEQLTKTQEAKRLEDFQEFQSEYPDIKLDEVPSEVFEQVSKGKTLADAYSRYEAKALKAQLEQVKLQNDNSQHSPGKVGSTDTDMSVLTEESIASMSPKELMGRWSEVKKLMKMK